MKTLKPIFLCEICEQFGQRVRNMYATVLLESSGVSNFRARPHNAREAVSK